MSKIPKWALDAAREAIGDRSAYLYGLNEDGTPYGWRTAEDLASIITKHAPDSTHDALVEALTKARPYVYGAYECAFPDEYENQAVLDDVDAALALAKGGVL